jgi:hypothetical protein
MGFLDGLFGRTMTEANSPKPELPETKTDATGYGNQIDPLSQSDRKDVAAVVQAAQQTLQARGRAARYTVFDEMDVEDVAAMLDAVVDAAVTFEDVSTGRGFKVEADDATIQTLLDEAVKRARLKPLVDEIARDVLKYGDAFVEPVFDRGLLVWAQTYRPSEIFVTRDDKGRLTVGKDADGFFAAYQQKRQGSVVAGWQPWEMVHFKLVPSRKLIYSAKSLLDPVVPAWRKLQLVEQGMVVARVTRAYPRKTHYVDMTGKDRNEQETTLRAYINRLTNRVMGRRPTDTNTNLPTVDVSEDLYVATGYTTGPDGKPYPKLNKVEVDDPAIAGLAELGDVHYLRAKVFSTVPSDTVGIKRNTTADADSQDLAYTRMLRRLQIQLEEGLRGILDQVLLSAGKLPSKTPYRIVLPAVDIKASWRFADARFRASLTLRNYLETGAISRRWAVKQAFNISDREVDAIWDQVAEEAANPIFQVVLAPARNGQGSVMPTTDDPDGDGETDTVPSAAAVIPATGADPTKPGTTKNGISRGTDLGKTLRGSNSGGAG